MLEIKFFKGVAMGHLTYSFHEILPGIVYNNTLSLRELVRQAVGKQNLYNISPGIEFDKLSRPKVVGGKMHPKLVSVTTCEKIKMVAEELKDANHLLGDLGELAQFTAHYPNEVAKYDRVFSLDENSRWENSDGQICVAYASVDGSKRCFRHCRFDQFIGKTDAVLIFEVAQSTHRDLVD